MLVTRPPRRQNKAPTRVFLIEIILQVQYAAEYIAAGFMDSFINSDDDSVITRHCWDFKSLFPVNTA